MGAVHVTLVLLVVVTMLGVIARRVSVPYPLLLVFGGLGISLVPGLPRVELDPELFFVLFLPPLLFADGWGMPVREFRAALRPILLLTLGLVVFTTMAVGWVAHVVVGLPWAVALALGAIVSPTDAVATAAITHRLHVPRRLVTVLNGESLVNDASGLVAFKVALTAAMTGAFSLGDALLQFLLLSVGGVAIGLAVAWSSAAFRRWYHRGQEPDPLIDITVSLLTPFAAFVPADRIGVSGVLAVVSAGLYLGGRDTVQMSPQTRMRTRTVWDLIVFLMNGLVFVLLGLQLRTVAEGLSSHSIATLAWNAAIVVVTTMVARLVWIYPGAYLPFLLSRRLRSRERRPPWTHIFIGGWAGMRGAVTLAGALSLPSLLADGSPFPGRHMVIFLAFAVILGTLVVQGLTLPWFIRRLGVVGDGLSEKEEATARLKAAQAAVKRLEELAATPGSRWETGTLAQVMEEYEEKIGHIVAEGEAREVSQERRLRDVELRREAIAAERQELVRLRNAGEINDEVLRRIQGDMDLEEARVAAILA